MIPVTKPYLPQFEKYNQYLSGIWQRKWLTNNGPLVNDLEKRLSAYLNNDSLVYVNNGTIALQIGIKALELRGEIITTPFSFVATTSSIVWESCTPVFADISAEDFNIDATKITNLISDKSTAILATHCFGNACDIEAIEKIARAHNLKIIYDAAHCFGTKYKNKSIFNYGDIATTSFHATKLFHSIEGGAIFSNNQHLKAKIKRMRNFGHDGPEKFNGVGINGKNSEFHAAMGLCVLDDVDSILKRRSEQYLAYRRYLNNSKFSFLKIREGCDFNYAYFPIVFQNEELLLKVKVALESEKISPRRYFYPSLSSLDYIDQKFSTPISDQVARTILCLPLFHELSNDDIMRISTIVLKASS